MNDFQNEYDLIRADGFGFYRQSRGLIEVSGAEAVQFLNGLVTNDVAKLDDGEQMLAAFPTLKGRMFAVVRVLRQGDKYLFETEETTRQKVYDNLFRFTFAGDFHIKEHSENYEFYRLFGDPTGVTDSIDGMIEFQNDYFVPKDSVDEFEKHLAGALQISAKLFEVLRIERGIPLYGVDLDEEVVVPEIGLENMISYEKGCYLGQEVIARIHFRGHVAKQLTGLVFEDLSEPSAVADGLRGAEIKSLDDKNAGRITSVTFSPKLGNVIALAYVRYAYLAEGTLLRAGDHTAKVKNLPFLR